MRSSERTKLINAEIAAAKAAGLAWTKPHEFLPGESAGAGYCGCCPKRALYVSYCTVLAGRVSYCEDCFIAEVGAALRAAKGGKR